MNSTFRTLLVWLAIFVVVILVWNAFQVGRKAHHDLTYNEFMEQVTKGHVQKVVLTEQTIEGTPVYAAGLDRDDELITVDGIAMSGASRLEDIIQRRKPGDTVRMTIRRRGETRDLAVTIAEDPALQLVPVERTGRAPSAAERQFRDRWLGSQQ